MYPVSSIVFRARIHLALLLLVASSGVSAQNRNLILLDPAHGGMDQGASFNGTLEKDVTLAFAGNLRALLTARNFTVVSTREADLPQLTSDQRASAANHLRPAVCLLLHATASGNGIHLVTSSLPAVDGPLPTALPWETAQAFFLPQSRRLANALGLALLRAKLPVTLSPAALRPLDNLTCAAVAIEIAPLAASSRVTPPTDAGYQHRLLEAIAAVLVDWRNLQPAGAASGGASQ